MVSISKEWLGAGIEAAMMSEEWKGMKNLEGLSTKLVPHHRSGTSRIIADGNVGSQVVPPVTSCCYPETIGLEMNAIMEKLANSDKIHCLNCLL